MFTAIRRASSFVSAFAPSASASAWHVNRFVPTP
jgi:hypothetical protein